MARAKKNVKDSEESDNVEMVKQKPPKSPSKERKPAKSLHKFFKSRANNPSMGEMVIAALKALKNDRGVTLVSIRKFIQANYDGFPKIGKAVQTDIKNCLRMEFENGKIEMTNGDGDAIKFNKLFKMTTD